MVGETVKIILKKLQHHSGRFVNMDQAANVPPKCLTTVANNGTISCADVQMFAPKILICNSTCFPSPYR